MILNILKTIALSILSERVIKRLISVGLEYIAKSTDNTLDDDMVKAVKESMGEIQTDK